MNPLRRLLLTAALMAGITPAVAQQFPTVPAQSVIGRLGIPGDTGPSQAIPFATFFSASGFVTLPVVSGDVAIFNGTTGKIKDAGGGAPFAPPRIVSASGIANGHSIPWLDENVQFGGNGVTPFGVMMTNPIIIGAAGSTIGSSTVGQTFSVRFTSSGLTGSPITATYTAIGGDTTATIAAGLCTAINANTTLHATSTELPIFCYSTTGSATFNIQWSAAFAPTGATPLTLASVGTGTVTIQPTVDTIDYAVMQLARVPTGRTPRDGDSLVCFDFTGNSSAGFDTHYSQMCVSSPTVTSGTQQGRTLFSSASNSATAQPVFYYGKGLVLYDSSHVAATAGDQGFGTINLPTAYYIGGNTLANATGLYAQGNNIFGGALAGSILNLQSTQSGSPSGDFVQIKAGGLVGYKFDGTNSTFGTSGSLVGSACFANATSGTICVKPPAGALGAAVLTLPDATDTLVGKATTDELTNKTLTSSVGKGTWTASGTWTLPAVTLGGALTYGGVTLTNAVTGTGKMALDTTPTFQTNFSLHAGTNQNYFIQGPIGGVVTTGVTFESLNDALSAFLPVQIAASLAYFSQGGIAIGTTTDPGAGGVLANTSIKSQGATSGIGYATGSGNAATQATSKSTTVTTFTSVNGTITMNGAALGAGTVVTFNLTGAANAASDLWATAHESVGTTGAYTINCRSTGAGTASCDVRNNTAGSLSEAIVIRAVIIKSVNSFLISRDLDPASNDNTPAFMEKAA